MNNYCCLVPFAIVHRYTPIILRKLDEFEGISCCAKWILRYRIIFSSNSFWQMYMNGCSKILVAFLPLWSRRHITNRVRLMEECWNFYVHMNQISGIIHTRVIFVHRCFFYIPFFSSGSLPPEYYQMVSMIRFNVASNMITGTTTDTLMSAIMFPKCVIF